MKIRNGFVSNSSSSSFLIRYWDFHEQKVFLTEEQIKKLEDYGFKPVNTYSIMDIECADWKLESLAPDENWTEPPLSYGFGVTCNQSDVVEWLVANEIPFKALCHYGHESIIFDGEKIYTIPNFGIEAEMYGVDSVDEYFDNKKTLKKKDIVKVRSKNEYKKTTESILNLSSEGS